MTTTYTPIASVTLSASASEVVFSGLPQTYRDLILVINGGHNTTSTISIELQPNSDSANGSLVGMYGYSGGTVSETASRIFFTMSGSGTIAIIQAMDYSATDKHKTFLIRSGATDEVWAIAGRWASTSAMTSLRILDTGGQTFDSGSTFNLFGVIS